MLGKINTMNSYSWEEHLTEADCRILYKIAKLVIQHIELEGYETNNINYSTVIKCISVFTGNT